MTNTNRTGRRPGRSAFIALAAAAGLWLPMAAAAAAEDASGDGGTGADVAADAEVVVTATRIETPRRLVGSAATVIDSATIEAKQNRNAADVLDDVPGVNVVPSGGPGKLTSVFMRGANSDQVLVLLDGIEMNDPSFNGSFNFGHLRFTNLERVEVVRGAMSTVWGSEAIGGVINLITRRGEGPPQASAYLEGGSFGTVAGGAAFSGGDDLFNYSVDASTYSDEGISVTPVRFRPAGKPSDRDGYDNLTLSGRFGLTPSDYVEFNAIARYVYGFTENDLVLEDPDSYEQVDQIFARGETVVRLFDGRTEHVFGVSLSDHDRKDRNRPDVFDSTTQFTNNVGRKIKADMRHNWYVTDDIVLTVGGEWEEDRLESDSFTQFASGFVSQQDVVAHVSTRAAYGQVQWALFDERLFGSSGVRVDDHETFGSYTTQRHVVGYNLKETGTTFRGTYGTGFKAPGLFNLLGRTAFQFLGFPAGNFIGNPDLRPETSETWEVGLDQKLFDGRVAFGGTYFNTDIEDLIQFKFLPTFDSTVENIASARADGFEIYAEVRPIPALTLRGDFTHLEAENRKTKSELPRRPKNTLALNVSYDFLPGANARVEVKYTGSQVDVDFVSGQPLHRDGYTVANIYLSYEIVENVTLYGRVENLLDETYENAAGFARPGIGGFVGLKGRVSLF